MPSRWPSSPIMRRVTCLLASGASSQLFVTSARLVARPTIPNDSGRFAAWRNRRSRHLDN